MLVAKQAIDVATETITLAMAESNITPAAVAGRIPESKPRYTFYHYPNSDALIFIYTCPSGSSIKERMLYASCRAGVVILATSQGLTVSQKVRPHQ
jgi:twinfilin-like protein